MKKLKRILCLFLALVMCLGMVNISALADETTYHCNGCNEAYTIGELVVIRDIPAKDCKDKDGQELGCPKCDYTLTNTNNGNRGPHSWSGWEKSENGTHTRKCSVCGETESESHNWNHETQPATCFEKGNEYDVCTVCGAQDNNMSSDTLTADFTKYDDNHDGTHKVYCWKCDGKADGHSYTVKCEDKDNDGKCDKCGGDVAKDETPCIHKNTTIVATDTTCEQQGIKKLVCKDCHEVLSEEKCPPVGHEFVVRAKDKDIAPTCTEKGLEAYTCKYGCGKIEYRDGEDAQGHKWGEWDLIQKGTLTEPGVFERKCSVCGATEQKKCGQVDSLGCHKPGKDGKEPTCTEDGYVVYECKECGYYEKVTLPATDHAWDYEHGNVIVMPTVNKDGTIRYTCKNDPSHTKDEVLKFSACDQVDENGKHKAEYLVTKEPTCTEKGAAQWWCPSCETVFENVEVPAKGHQTKIIVDNEPTCTMKGNEHEVCTVCGVTVESKENPALGHKWGSWQSDGAKGHYQVCDRCQSHSDTVDHNFGAWVTVKAATTTEKGEEKHVCTDCNYEETRTTSKIEVENPANPEDKDPIESNPPETDIPDDNPPTTGDTNGNQDDKDPIESNPPETDIPDDNPPTTGDTNGNQEDKDPIESNPPETDIPDGNLPTTGNTDDTTDIFDGETPTTDIPGELTDIFDEEVPLAYVDGKLNTADHFAYIIGYPDDKVKPVANITRAEAVTVFFRLMTDEFRAANWSTVNAYADVDASAWYNNAVSTATKAGIFQGDNGNARPNDFITRAEFAALAARFIGGQIADDGAGDFADTADHWAAKEIRLAVKAGWIKGYPGNVFKPDEYITRAEVMAIVNRMLDRTPDKDHMLSDMKVWSDNMDTSAWYYADVQEATNSHDYERAESATEIWTAMEEIRDWNALEKVWATAESGK